MQYAREKGSRIQWFDGPSGRISDTGTIEVLNSDFVILTPDTGSFK